MGLTMLRIIEMGPPAGTVTSQDAFDSPVIPVSKQIQAYPQALKEVPNHFQSSNSHQCNRLLYPRIRASAWPSEAEITSNCVTPGTSPDPICHSSLRDSHLTTRPDVENTRWFNEGEAEKHPADESSDPLADRVIATRITGPGKSRQEKSWKYTSMCQYLR